jgi:hypothetical protein
MSKTSNLIKSSYSVKYMGVIDGNIGVLSQRMNLGDF